MAYKFNFYEANFETFKAKYVGFENSCINVPQSVFTVVNKVDLSFPPLGKEFGRARSRMHS